MSKSRIAQLFYLIVYVIMRLCKVSLGEYNFEEVLFERCKIMDGTKKGFKSS